jgi:hypothetical protein
MDIELAHKDAHNVILFNAPYNKKQQQNSTMRKETGSSLELLSTAYCDLLN